MLNADLCLCVLLYPIHIIKFLSLWMCWLEVGRSKDSQASSLGSRMQSGVRQGCRWLGKVARHLL